MTTLKITVNNRKNARLLTKLLKTMAFVKEIEEDIPVTEESDQFELLKNFFNSIAPDSLFKGINNPAEWQKNIRNEWETN